MPKPKVVNLITRTNIGGATFQVLLLTERLEELGYETLLVAGTCEAGEGEFPIPAPLAERLITVDGLSRSISPWRDLRAVWRMYRILLRESPAIVHTHTAKAGLVGRIAASLARVPVIVHTFHGNTLSGYFSPRASSTLCWIERLLARVTDRICVVSEQQLEELAGRFRLAPRKQFSIVPLGVDLTNEPEQPLPARRDDALRVGWMGRLVRIKGVPLLAAVIEETARQGIPARFLVGGDGPDRGIMQRIASARGSDRVQWSGWEKDAGGLIARCHLMIQTSGNEGTPVALIQGMAAGRPFISTAVGGVVDLVQEPELRQVAGCRWFANGVLAEPNPAAFASALQEFSSDPALLTRMGAEARRFAVKRFRAERLVNDIDCLYAELCQKRAAPVRSRGLDSGKHRGEAADCGPSVASRPGREMPGC